MDESLVLTGFSRISSMSLSAHRSDIQEYRKYGNKTISCDKNDNVLVILVISAMAQR